MAGGSILDMQDLGDGRYQATMANGSMPIFTGDAGRQAYERLRKEESATGPNALAQAPAERKGTTVVDAPSGNWVERPAQDATESKPSGMVPGGFAQDLAERPPAATPQKSAPPAQAPPSGPSALPHSVEGVDPVTQKKITGPGVMINGQMFVDRGPGTRGSPGGITKLGQQTLDERAAADAKAAELQAATRKAEMQGVAIATEQAAKEQAFLKKQADAATLAQQNAEKEAADADNYVLDLRARADKAIEDHANSRMPEDSMADKIIDGLATAIGAFGATLGKTPNFAGEYVNQIKQNKIRKWEAEVNIKGSKANNLLSRLKDATGDMKLAKSAASMALDKQMAAEAQQMASSTRTDQIRNTWETVQNAAAANGIKSEQKYNEDARLAFMTNKMYNRPATAGTPGGLVLATQGSYGDAQSQSVQLAKLAADKLAAEKGGAGGSPVATERTDKISSMTSALAASEQVIGELNKRGVGGNATDDPTSGLVDRVLNQEGNELLNQATITMAKGMQKGQSDADAADAVKRAQGGGSGRDRLQAAQRGQQEIANKLRVELSTLPDAQKVQILQQMPPAVRAKVLAP